MTRRLLITIVGLACVACGGGAPQTHAEIEKGAYAADDGVCVTEAQDLDSGTQCVNKYERLYSVFWPDSGVTVCDVTIADAGAEGGK